MPIQFEYRADLNCLHAVGEGRLNRQDFLDYHRNITIPDPPPILLILSDYRKLDASDLTTSDIEEIRTSALSRTENKYDAVKEALVVSDGLGFGLSRMYDGVVHSDKYEAGVFTDMNAAKSWLGLPDSFATKKPS
jgi:hypothetical protein